MTAIEVDQWSGELDRLYARFADRSTRSEPRRRARQYLSGLVAGVDRKNGWTLAEQAGDLSPDGMQRLLRWADWDIDAVRDEVRDYVIEHLGDPNGVLIIDDTGFLKKGVKSAGVARQYSGTAGRIENCQIGVFLAYASPTGHAFLDRALYLPKAWAEDAARRREAGVPEAVRFATKGELARAMLARAFAAEVPAAWVTGDEPYGNDGELRRWLEAQQRPYVLAVARSHAVWAAVDGGPAQVRAEDLVATIPADGWQRIAVGAGSKGPRVFDWACGRLPFRAEGGFAQWVLIRRSVSRPRELAFYHAYGPAETSVDALARVAGTRWAIEAGFERAKGEVGLDQYEVRSWAGWHRHVTLCLLAHAFLEATRAVARGDEGKKGGAPTSSR